MKSKLVDTRAIRKFCEHYYGKPIDEIALLFIDWVQRAETQDSISIFMTDEQKQIWELMQYQ